MRFSISNLSTLLKNKKITRIERLRCLCLTSCVIDSSLLGYFPNLQKLRLKKMSNSLLLILDQLPNMNNLTNLYLDNRDSQIYSEQLIDSLIRNPNRLKLKKLILKDNRLSPDLIVQLIKSLALEDLRISCENITLE